MSDSSTIAEPTIFKELPKEQQKELRKEFDKTTNAGRNLIIASVIMGAVLVIIAVIGVLTDHVVFSGAPFPVFFFPVFIALNEDKFAKWLEKEKNIIMKRKKPKQ
ncbi:MAG: hypothetical protein FWD16_05900 [Clostridia bacterium]|nr:hypothetical protein [Clostridia bacterium]